MGGSISLIDLYDQARAAAEEELKTAKPDEGAAILLAALEQRPDLGKEEAREEALRILTEKHTGTILEDSTGISLEDLAKALPPAPTCH